MGPRPDGPTPLSRHLPKVVAAGASVERKPGAPFPGALTEGEDANPECDQPTDRRRPVSAAPAPIPVRPGTMKAWVQERYGPPESLQFREVPFPGFRDDREMLIRVAATSINPADRHALKPPLIFRRGQGMLRPKSGRRGLDVVGRVELVGQAVTEFHVGDEVFGVARGAFGEYAVGDPAELALRPPGLSVEQAASLPIAACTALQGLRDKAQVQPGQYVLINGASGGVGTFGVQIAKALGAHVSCVCSPANVEWNRSVGVDRIFDYTKEDFAPSGQRYDVIFDTQLNHSLSQYRKALTPGGQLLIVGGGPGGVSQILPRLLVKMLGSRLVGPRTKFFIAAVKSADLQTLAAFVTSGRLTPRIDRRYPLAQLQDGMRYLIDGHARGKIVLTV
jgi:NADPH:quinone reductase-like Zn-dependent oxidoreductase